MSDDGEILSDPVYEMLWDCDYCGTKQLLGKTHRHCPHCGAAQDPAGRYFPPPGQEVAVVEHRYYGADLSCPSCSLANSGNSEFCRSCGTPLHGAARVSLISEQPKAPVTDRKATGAPFWRGKVFKAFVAVGGLIAAAVVYNFVFTKQIVLSADSHHWRRVTLVEEFGPVQRSSWCEFVPRHAQSVSRRREVRERRRVADGENCTTRRVDNGDGTFRTARSCSTRYRTENIYGDKCYYTVLDWREQSKKELSAANLTPQWANPPIVACETPAVGCQRTKHAVEEYWIDFVLPDSRRKTCKVDYETWKSFSPDKRYLGELSGLTGRLRCRSVTAAN